MRLVLGDDSMLFREGVARLLSDRGIEVVAQAATVEDIVRKVDAHRPDAAIVDIRMPPSHTDEGLRAAEEIFRRAPEVGVVLLSQHVDSDLAQRLLERRSTGIGYLLKDRVGDIDRFVADVRAVAEGSTVMDPLIVSRLLGRARRPDLLAELSPREREVLEMMARGLNNRAIGDRLTVSERTVETHVATIFRKLRLNDSTDDHRRVLAVITYLRA